MLSIDLSEEGEDEDAAELLKRALKMSDEAVEASLVARGNDLDELDARMREMLRRVFPKRWPLN